MFPKNFSIAILFGLPVNGRFFPFKEAILSANDNMTFLEDSTFFVTISLMEVWLTKLYQRDDLQEYFTS